MSSVTTSPKNTNYTLLKNEKELIKNYIEKTDKNERREFIRSIENPKRLLKWAKRNKSFIYRSPDLLHLIEELLVFDPKKPKKRSFLGKIKKIIWKFKRLTHKIVHFRHPLAKIARITEKELDKQITQQITKKTDKKLSNKITQLKESGVDSELFIKSLFKNKKSLTDNENFRKKLTSYIKAYFQENIEVGSPSVPSTSIPASSSAASISEKTNENAVEKPQDIITTEIPYQSPENQKDESPKEFELLLDTLSLQPEKEKNFPSTNLHLLGHFLGGFMASDDSQLEGLPANATLDEFIDTINHLQQQHYPEEQHFSTLVTELKNSRKFMNHPGFHCDEELSNANINKKADDLSKDMQKILAKLPLRTFFPYYGGLQGVEGHGVIYLFHKTHDNLIDLIVIDASSHFHPWMPVAEKQKQLSFKYYEGLSLVEGQLDNFFFNSLFKSKYYIEQKRSILT